MPLAQRERRNSHREHVGTPDPGSLTASQSGSRLKEGFRVAFKSRSRRLSCHLMLMYFNSYPLFYIEILRSSAGGQPGLMNIQQGRANPFPYILTKEKTHFLLAMQGSVACIRQFWDETFLGEWMSWQMLSAGNLLKSQLVRGYRSCSVKHSWFTQNGLKM